MTSGNRNFTFSRKDCFFTGHWWFWSKSLTSPMLSSSHDYHHQGTGTFTLRNAAMLRHHDLAWESLFSKPMTDRKGFIFMEIVKLRIRGYRNLLWNIGIAQKDILLLSLTWAIVIVGEVAQGYNRWQWTIYYTTCIFRYIVRTHAFKSTISNV